MTAFFEITTLTRNHMYIETGCHGFGVIEMKPRWLDDTTLQLALSMQDAGRSGDPDDEDDGPPWTTIMAQQVNITRTCPNLAEAIAWTKQHRMGTKLVHVQLDHVPEHLIEEAKRIGTAPISGVNSRLECLTRTSYNTNRYSPATNTFATVKVPSKPYTIFSRRLSSSA